MKETLLLIDANSLIHRSYHALPPFTTPDGRPSGALYGLSSILLKIINEGLLGNGAPKYVAAAFDRPEPTFRKMEYKEYKGTRKPAEKELISQIIESRNLLDLFKMKNFELAGWEADDLVMTLANKFKDENDLQVVILSGDLDVLQAVTGNKVVVLVPQKGISNTVTYDEDAVIKRFGVSPDKLADFKGLVGDKSDNIPGVPGIGPKTTASIIKKYNSLENLYKEIDEIGISDSKLQIKLSEYRDKALLSKKLATLRRDVPVSPSLRELEFPRLDIDSLTDYFKNMGFESLIVRLPKRNNDNYR